MSKHRQMCRICFMMFLFSIVFVIYNPSISKPYNTHQYTSIHFVVDSKKIQNFFPPLVYLKDTKHSTCSTIFWVSVVASAALPPVPSRGGPWPSEAATTSSRRPPPVTSAGSGTCCGRCPAPWPRRTEAAPPRCTAQRTKATRRSAGCCWRRGPRSTPGLRKASRPWRDGCTVLWGDFRVQKKIEVKMWNDVKWCEM